MSASVISLKFSSSTSSSHHLLLRRFSSEIVLLFNVPPWCSEPLLKNLLAEHCGPLKLVKFLSKAESEAWSSSSGPLPLPVVSETVESPYFKDKPEMCFNDALVVFKAALGAEKLVGRKKEDPLVLKSETRNPVTGIRRFISDYSADIISDWSHFQKDIDDYMIAYDATKAAEVEKLKEMGEEDEEGWVTVTSKSKKGAKKRGNNNSDKARAKSKAAAKNKELLNFYKFQKTEKKEDLIQNLREKFEEDKKRVASMRAERKFKPY